MNMILSASIWHDFYVTITLTIVWHDVYTALYPSVYVSPPARPAWQHLFQPTVLKGSLTPRHYIQERITIDTISTLPLERS